MPDFLLYTYNMDILEQAFEEELNYINDGEINSNNTTIVINNNTYNCVSDPMLRISEGGSRNSNKFITTEALHILKSSGINIFELKPGDSCEYKSDYWLIKEIEEDEIAVRLLLSHDQGKRTGKGFF